MRTQSAALEEDRRPETADERVVAEEDRRWRFIMELRRSGYDAVGLVADDPDSPDDLTVIYDDEVLVDVTINGSESESVVVAELADVPKLVAAGFPVIDIAMPRQRNAVLYQALGVAWHDGIPWQALMIDRRGLGRVAGSRGRPPAGAHGHSSLGSWLQWQFARSGIPAVNRDRRIAELQLERENPGAGTAIVSSLRSA